MKRLATTLTAVTVVLAAAAFAASASAPDAGSASADRDPAFSVRTFTARDLVREVNAERVRRGLKPLRVSMKLMAAAQSHSRAMGKRGFFSHESANGESFWRRVRRFYGTKGYRVWFVGENLLWGATGMAPRDAVVAWLKSPAHRRNLLARDWREIGISARRFAAAPGPFGRKDVTLITADFGVRY